MKHSHIDSTAERLPNLNLYNEPESNSGLDDILSSYADILDENQKPKYTILIVDDNIYIRELVEGVLSMLFNTITAEDGKIALSIARSISPDLIVSDIMMPNMDGMEFCRIMKTDIELSHIPLILLTALADEESNIDGLLTGADDYITKPFVPKLLLIRCANFIRNRMMLQRRFASDLDTTSNILTTNPVDIKFLARVDDIIEQYLDEEDFDVNNLCQELAMSRTNVYNKFKALIANSPNAYILSQKIRKATSLLLQVPKLSVLDISIQLGFKTPNYFSKTFKKITGLTPLEYRKKHNN